MEVVGVELIVVSFIHYRYRFEKRFLKLETLPPMQSSENFPSRQLGEISLIKLA